MKLFLGFWGFCSWRSWRRYGWTRWHGCAHETDDTAGNWGTHRYLLILIGQGIGHHGQGGGEDLRIQGCVQIDGFAVDHNGAANDAIEAKELQVDTHKHRRDGAIVLHLQIAQLQR